tara:strand:- start:338 stop:553 length:216 start_codon:yes stop_codon:yes gene_type:complete
MQPPKTLKSIENQTMKQQKTFSYLGEDEIKSKRESNHNYGIKNSLLEKYKPSKGLALLKGIKEDTKDKKAA